MTMPNGQCVKGKTGLWKQTQGLGENAEPDPYP